ncbi:Piwi-domain-containing protein, partial [Martensiomyces pterosporus]
GTLGRRQRVVANFVELQRLPQGQIYQYDVDIVPKSGPFKKLPPSAFMRSVFDDAMRRHRTTKLNGIPVVYDTRKIAYAPNQICRNGEVLLLEAAHTGDGRAEEFTVKIQETAVIDMSILSEFVKGSGIVDIASIQPALTALDLAIGSVASSEMVGFGRSFFTRAQSMPISGGLELWRGFSLSVRPGEGKMYLNANTAVTSMYASGPLLDGLMNVLNLRDPSQLKDAISQHTMRDLRPYLNGLGVVVRHRSMRGQQKFSVKGLTTKPLDKETFAWEDPSKPGSEEVISVAAYYKRRYNIALRYPFLPGVVGKKGSAFPIELCEVVENQRYKGKLDERQTADMVKFACQRPSENQNRIIDVLRQLNLGQAPVIKAFGLALPSSLTEVESRVLPAPTINYGRQSREASLTPSGGAWNMRDKCVLTSGMPLKYWAVLVLANKRFVPESSMQHFVTSLVRMCNQTGYRIEQPHPPIAYGNPNADISREMRKACDMIRLPPGTAPQLLLVVLPSTNTVMYQTVKNCAYTTLGIQTQCMQSKHVQKASPQYCANLCLKINAKLGGTNQGLVPQNLQKMVRMKPTLFLGCDVTHPAPGEGDRPSIASVVGSTDLMGLRYTATLIQLPSRQELVSKLQEAIVRHLKLFFKGTRTKPQRIVFYRDGVSETQFAQVRDREIIEIQRACASLEKGYSPDITFLAVLKRHNTRFFPVGREGDRTGNCVPGTVVDRGVTLPGMFDFYLFAHGAIQGTSRPTHYYVLHDDAKFTSDEIQQLTYHLCYTYAICTRSVSLVPPVYYAHRVADRARCHLVD